MENGRIVHGQGKRRGGGGNKRDEKEGRARAQEETHGESHKNYLMTTVNKHTGVRSFSLHIESIEKQEASVAILPDSCLNFTSGINSAK